jgi:hypothetical protein
MNRLNGWRMWLCVTVVVCKISDTKLKPLILCGGLIFPRRGLRIKRVYTTKWKLIIKLMEQLYLGFDALAQVDEVFVQASFTAATLYLKTGLDMFGTEPRTTEFFDSWHWNFE